MRLNNRISWLQFLRMSRRIIASEIKNHRGFTLFFVANLSLGLFGFSLLDSFKIGIEKVLNENSKSILGADLSISSRQQITPEDEALVKKFLPTEFRASRLTEMYSMVYVSGQSRLVNVRAIDPNFPLYGSLELGDGKVIVGKSQKEITERNSCWAYPELLQQLKVKIGDEIKIGAFACRLTQEVHLDPGTNLAGGALAPRIYMGQDYLAATQLLRKGSTAWYSLLIQLPEGSDAEAIVNSFRNEYPESQLTLRSHRDEAFSAGRIIVYLGDYLGLAAMVALFLSAVGSSFLFRSFIGRKTREIATLQALGLLAGRSTLIYAAFLLVLGFLAALVSLGLTAIALPASRPLLHIFFNLDVALNLQIETIFTTVILSTLASLLICLPSLMNIQRIRPAELFQEAQVPSLRISTSIVALIPAIFLFWGLAVIQTKSFKVGSSFVVAAMTSALFLYGFSLLSIFWLEKIRINNLPWRLAIRQLTRSRLRTSTAFLAIAMGTMVINIIPQLRSSLRGELLYPEKSRVPSFFLFDIQPEQLEPLQEVLARLDVPLRNVSPMVRATLTEINQQKFSRNTDALVATRESETEQRFRNRGMNLTYRSKLSEDESIVEGLNFSELPSDPPAISLEQRFAKRLAIKIGDTLTFDVQGVPISGKVVNFRKVHWTSFQPNFFIQFAPGALEDAPQTYLASIPKIPLSLQTTLQNKITESLPNVSLVNVSRVVTRILSTVEQMVWALQLMAAVAVAAGLLVLYSIARQQIYERRHETNLLRILGAKSGLIMGLVDREFFVVSFGATFLGALLSLVVSYILSRFLFDGIWIFAWEAPLASCLIVVSVSLGIARLSISHTLKQSPQSILQAG